MTDIDKAAVYRKAAEVIVRDGKTEGLYSGEDRDKYYGRQPVRNTYELALKDPRVRVCALGACSRAQYELYGQLSEDPYLDYEFKVDFLENGSPLSIWAINDACNTSAEDIALLLKRQAEVEDG